MPVGGTPSDGDAAACAPAAAAAAAAQPVKPNGFVSAPGGGFETAASSSAAEQPVAGEQPDAEHSAPDASEEPDSRVWLRTTAPPKQALQGGSAGDAAGHAEPTGSHESANAPLAPGKPAPADAGHHASAGPARAASDAPQRVAAASSEAAAQPGFAGGVDAALQGGTSVLCASAQQQAPMEAAAAPPAGSPAGGAHAGAGDAELAPAERAAVCGGEPRAPLEFEIPVSTAAELISAFGGGGWADGALADALGAPHQPPGGGLQDTGAAAQAPLPAELDHGAAVSLPAACAESQVQRLLQPCPAA